MKTTATAVAVAIIGFIAGNIWIFFSADMFVRYFYEARMVGLTHVFTLGWVSLMIVGVLQQLAPPAFGLRAPRGGLTVAVSLWVPGAVAMIAGFAFLVYTLAAAGAFLLILAIAIVLFVFLPAFRGVRRQPPHNHLLAAFFYLGAAAILGLWMAFSKGFDVPLPAPFHRVLFAHIYLAGVGWAGMMILAVMSRLFPQPHLRHSVQARIRFAAFHIGLIGLSAGLLAGGEWYAPFGSLLAIACIWYAAAFIPVLLEFRHPPDRSTAFLVTAWSCLALVGLIGLWLSVVPGPPSIFDLQLQFAYGFIYMFGWLTFMILGMLYRMIPTQISKLLAPRGISPSGVRRVFADPDLQIIVWLTLVLGLAVSSSAILTESVPLFRFGWAMWLAGTIGVLVAFYRMGAAVRNLLRSR